MAVFSTSPSMKEWIFCDDRAKGIIKTHVDLPSLIMDLDSMNARELFGTFQSVYGVFIASDSVDEFFKHLQDLQKESIEAGS